MLLGRKTHDPERNRRARLAFDRLVRKLVNEMKTIPLAEAKAKLSGLVDQVVARDAEFLITRNGRPAAMLVSPDEIEGWKATAEILSDPAFMADIRRGLADLEAGRSIVLRTDADFDRVFGAASRPPRARTRRSRPRPRKR